MDYIKLHNNQTVNLKEIPELIYKEFRNINIELLSNNPERHCVNYFGVENENLVMLYSCIADDTTHEIFVFSTIVERKREYPSLTAQNHNFEKLNQLNLFP